MFLLEIGLPQTCFEIALTWFQAKVWLWIHQGSIGNNLENKSYNFSREKMRVWPTGSVATHQHVKKDVFPKSIWSSLCWGEGKNVVDDNINHRGEGLYFSLWIRLISWKSSECCWWSRHICREISWRCNRSTMTSNQRNDEVKGYWNHGYDTNSKLSLLFKAKW